MIQHSTIAQITEYYPIEMSSLHHLNESGIIKILKIEETEYIHHDELPELERIIRIQQDLNISFEAMDIVLNLIEKIKALQLENNVLKIRLQNSEY
jgi:chaperone modulatory protein CbpM